MIHEMIEKEAKITERTESTKVFASDLLWLEEEKIRVKRATGRKPSNPALLSQAIALLRSRETSGAIEIEAGKDRIRIPRTLLPLVEWLVALFSARGSPEEEMLKDTIRLLTARKSADLKR
jgi:hypothetical protein